MPRKYPTVDVDCLGGFDVNPGKCIGEYLASKENEKIYMMPPNFDSPGDSIEVFYIQEKMQNNLLTEQLKELRKQQIVQLKLSSQRNRRLYKDQEELRARFVNVNTFIREFTEKRKIALRKIEDEIEKQKKLTEANDIKLKGVEELKIFKKQLKATVDEYLLYETVLKGAAANAKCPSIEALMNRCDAIMVAQGDIMQLSAAKIVEIEAMRKKIVDIVQQVAMVYGGLMNELTEMNRSYHKAKSETFFWERILLKANSTVIHQNRRREFVRDAVNQIYRMLCRRSGEDPEFTRIQVEKSLNFIKEEVQLLQKVLQKYNNDR